MADISDLISVRVAIPSLEKSLKDVFDDEKSETFKDIKYKILNNFGIETRRRARIILNARKNSAGMYPSGGGGTDYRYGGIKLKDTIFYEVDKSHSSVRIYSGSNIRPDARMYNKPVGEETTMIGNPRLHFWSFTKGRRVNPFSVTRKGIYYLGGAFESVLKDIQKLTERWIASGGKFYRK